MATLCPSVRVELCLHNRFYATSSNILLIMKAYLGNDTVQVQLLTASFALKEKATEGDCFSSGDFSLETNFFNCTNKDFTRTRPEMRTSQKFSTDEDSLRSHSNSYFTIVTNTKRVSSRSCEELYTSFSKVCMGAILIE